MHPRKASVDVTVSASDVRAQIRSDEADPRLRLERGLAEVKERMQKKLDDLAAQFLRSDSRARTTSDADSGHLATAAEGTAPERRLSAWEEELALTRIARSYETYLITAAGASFPSPPAREQGERVADIAARALSCLGRDRR